MKGWWYRAGHEMTVCMVSGFIFGSCITGVFRSPGSWAAGFFIPLLDVCSLTLLAGTYMRLRERRHQGKFLAEMRERGKQ